MRTARSRSSSGYLLGRPTFQIFQGRECPDMPGQLRHRRQGGRHPRRGPGRTAGCGDMTVPAQSQQIDVAVIGAGPGKPGQPTRLIGCRAAAAPARGWPAPRARALPSRHGDHRRQGIAGHDRRADRPEPTRRAANPVHHLRHIHQLAQSGQPRRNQGVALGGDNQRVAVGRAFMNQPDPVLIDEPTSALGMRITHFADRALNIVDGILGDAATP